MRQVQDHWFRRAKADGYRARSAYKLEEIQQATRLVRPGMTLLDLGCAPGSWLQYLDRVMKGSGALFGVDLQEVEPLRLKTPVVVAQFDLTRLITALPPAFPAQYDGIVSDAAPRTTGTPFSDHVHSVELCREVMAVAAARLKPGGFVVMKVFQGGDFPALVKEVRAAYAKVKTIKPDSSRDESVEIFLVGTGKKQPIDGATVPRASSGTSWHPRAR